MYPSRQEAIHQPLMRQKPGICASMFGMVMDKFGVGWMVNINAQK
jgi:uncharacterized glyoxalase superfamily protein PhnB